MNTLSLSHSSWPNTLSFRRLHFETFLGNSLKKWVTCPALETTWMLSIGVVSVELLSWLWAFNQSSAELFGVCCIFRRFEEEFLLKTHPMMKTQNWANCKRLMSGFLATWPHQSHEIVKMGRDFQTFGSFVFVNCYVCCSHSSNKTASIGLSRIICVAFLTWRIICVDIFFFKLSLKYKVCWWRKKKLLFSLFFF